MSLLEEIKSRQLELRKTRTLTSGYQASALTVVLGEVARLDKASINDTSVLKCLNKVAAGVQESLGHSRTTELEAQWDILDEFVTTFTPKQLTEIEIQEIIEYLPDGVISLKDYTLGGVQKYFKENFPNRYNAKIVSETYKELTNE